MTELSPLMKAKFWFCLFSAAVLVVVVFCLRQRTLNELRAGNDSLRHQLQVPAPAEETNTVQLGNQVVALSSEEHTELLRLRGQVAPLRRELQEMSNRVATVVKTPPRREAAQSALLSSPDPAVRKAEIERLNAYMRSEPYKSVRNLSIALGNYIKAHSGELPDALANLEASAGHPLTSEGSERFELMRHGKIPEEALTSTLVAREKEGVQLPDGSWRRHYVRADGGTCTATLGPSPKKPDWKAWERATERGLKQKAMQPQQKTPP